MLTLTCNPDEGLDLPCHRVVNSVGRTVPIPVHLQYSTFFRFLLLILQDVARLAFEGLAESVEGGKTDGFGLTRFQDGKVGKGNTHTVGQFGKRHLTTGHHDIEGYAYHTVN